MPIVLLEGTLTDVGTIDEAEKVQERNSWDDIQINLQTKLTLGDRIKLNDRVAVSELRVST